MDLEGVLRDLSLAVVELQEELWNDFQVLRDLSTELTLLSRKFKKANKEKFLQEHAESLAEELDMLINYTISTLTDIGSLWTVKGHLKLIAEALRLLRNLDEISTELPRIEGAMDRFLSYYGDDEAKNAFTRSRPAFVRIHEKLGDLYLTLNELKNGLLGSCSCEC